MNTTVAELKKLSSTEIFVCFSISIGIVEIDYIFIERKTNGKRRTSAVWSTSSDNKSTIGNLISRLRNMGFNTKEVEDACIKMGWGNELMKS